MLKFFRIPFAQSGDKTAVPDAVDVNGFVSYTAGYGFDYQRQKTDPAAKNIERDKMNEIFFDITTAIAELQSQGVPDYITSALNGGAAYSYGQYAVVKYSGDLYVSLVAANTALPSDATKWALLPIPSRLQSALNIRATAGGTANALTGAFTPAIAALPAAPDTLSVMVRAGSANTSATPTFAADSTAAKTIVKGANTPLVAGDIGGAGHWLHLDYDPTLDKWVLQNPIFGAYSATPAFLSLTQTFTKAQRGAQGQLADGATITPDFSTANNFQVQLAGNRTLANPTNAAPGQSGVIEIFQDATGSRTLALDWGYSPQGGNAPTLSTTALTRDQWAYYVGTYQSAPVTISIATPGVITWNGHGLKGGEKIRLATTGALPTGLSAGVTYFVKPVDANTFQLSATLGGTAINTSGSQSGTHTATAASITISQLKAIA